MVQFKMQTMRFYSSKARATALFYRRLFFLLHYQAPYVISNFLFTVDNFEVFAHSSPVLGRDMTEQKIVDPLHGVTLKMIVEQLVERYGWEGLGNKVEIRCFTHNPSLPSSLKFLRKTPWARDKVESLYLESL